MILEEQHEDDNLKLNRVSPESEDTTSDMFLTLNLIWNVNQKNGIEE